MRLCSIGGNSISNELVKTSDIITSHVENAAETEYEDNLYI